MGIPKGVTPIVGGGYHGKSTLLQTLELGIYNHIPGDGREFCVSLPNTVKVRASNGRYIVKIDISTFINNLPFENDTAVFSSENASGSTSQAASISESIEVGANVFLMDEDTCAANFMICDKRMQQLVTKENEPITSFIDRIRQLYEEKDISTILVMGGSGDYFDVADYVIQMIKFIPHNVSQQARHISKEFPTGRQIEGGHSFFIQSHRIPLAESINPYNEYNRISISSPDTSKLIFGKAIVDLSDVDQIVESAQTKAIGLAIYYAQKYMDGTRTLNGIVRLVMKDINSTGIDVLDQHLTGDISKFRGFELASAINRLRGVKVK